MKLNFRVSGERFSWNSALLALTLVAIAGAIALGFGFWSRISQSAAVNRAVNEPFLKQSQTVSWAQPQNKVRTALAQLPLGFEPNQGQTDAAVKFLARGNGYGLFLTANEAVLKFQHSAGTASVLRMKLTGANSNPAVSGTDELPGKSNYLIGNDPGRWRRNVPRFAQVGYRDLYPGIDLVYYGNQGELEYDFEVAPGADPKSVQLSFDGAEKLVLDASGDLIVRTGTGNVRLHAPMVYQQEGTEKRAVDGKFVLASGNRVGFQVGPHDGRRKLVIDPVLSYSSYLGGSADEISPTIAVDPAFNIYVTGQTASADFPMTSGVFQPNPGGPANIFVTKFDSTGSALVFSTYVGGNGTDSSSGIAVDLSLNVCLAGTTNSTNFPTFNGFQDGPVPPGKHVFVSQLKADGTGLLYSTYLAGSGMDTASGLAIDNKGNAYVTGTTTSTTSSGSLTPFPTTPGALQNVPLSTTDTQFFMSKLSTTVSGTASLVYSTFFGGGNPSTNALVTGGGIALDSSGFVYITGGTNFLNINGGTNNFPILNAAQGSLDCPTNTNCPTNPTSRDAFVAKINPSTGTAGQLVYSTYLGGSGDDIGFGIAVDTGSNVYVTGSTSSTDAPRAGTPFQGMPGGGTDAFVAKLNNPARNTAVAITYFSYLGGLGNDSGAAIAVDQTGMIRITGTTASLNFPVVNAAALPQQTFGGGASDAFVARIDTTATSATSPNNFSDYLGGSGDDRGTGITLDANSVTYVTGDTRSVNFPIAGTPFQPANKGLSSDAFVSKLVSVSDLALTPPTPTVTPVGVGNPVTFNFLITNKGPDPTAGVTFRGTFPTTGATVSSANTTAGTCAAPGGGSVLCSLGTLANGATATVGIPLTPTTAGQALNSSGQVFVSSVNPPSVDPNLANNSATGSVLVTDFSVGENPPNSVTVVAGNSATYQVTVTPLPTYPNTVSLSCSAGLPTTGAGCTFSTNPVTMTNNSAASSTLTISTTARPATANSLQLDLKALYAIFLPASSFALLGVGLTSRRRRWAIELFFGLVVSLVVFQSACGRGSKAAPTGGGTAAGTYTVTITGTSGTASHAIPVTLIVQ